MKKAMRTILLLCLFSLAAFGQIVRNLTYSGLSGEITGTCSVSYPIYGELPVSGGRNGEGPYPVAIYIGGTNEPFESRVGREFVSRMVSHGFAAFVLAYPNRVDAGCPAITNKAACMFGSTEGSALDVIARRVPKADLTRIVTAGISQGAQIAVIAGNYNEHIEAAWAMGVGNIISLGTTNLPMQQCMNEPRHVLQSMEIFAANAADDPLLDVPTVNDELKSVTGNTDCSNSFHNANGSGCETIPVSAFQAGSGHAYPFSDFQHWSTDTMIDWGLPHLAQWLCDIVGCQDQSR